MPPEQRMLNVTVLPSHTTLKPSQKATVGIKLTDALGKPFVGSTVVSIYDKAVEYISGGSNVPEIKAFFWQWRRNHQTVTETNLNRYFDNLLRENEVGMQSLGLFGATLEDERAGAGVMWQSRTGGLFFGVEHYQVAGLAGATSPPRSGAIPPPAPMAPAPDAAGAPGGGGPPLAQPTIRSNFADTALWVGSLTTNEQGEAEVSLTMPENLTTWKVKVWALGHGTKVGQGDARRVITRART